MKKKVIITTQGQRADIGPYIIYRMIGNREVQAVGPIVFLDHVVPIVHSADEPLKKANGEGAHPHRGIATLTYLISGEAVHLDSKGHYAKVHSGGAQWMKAGSGIIHDEVVNVDSLSGDLLTHGFQFWINLPGKNKAENPEYLAVQGNEVPKKMLDNNTGWLKVIAGEYENLSSRIPVYLKQFIYHIHLESGKQFSFLAEEGLEYAAFLPLNSAKINGIIYKKGDLLVFDRDRGNIEILNDSKTSTDIILLGGEVYQEPIIAQGPFVMNSQSEISQAYEDFYKGRYGKIDYSQIDY